jgi:hypothetical protein
MVAGFGIGLLVGMMGALVGTILLGSIPGISIGSHLTVRLPRACSAMPWGW